VSKFVRPLKYDLYYIKYWSLALELKTVEVVVEKKEI